MEKSDRQSAIDLNDEEQVRARFPRALIVDLGENITRYKKSEATLAQRMEEIKKNSK